MKSVNLRNHSKYNLFFGVLVSVFTASLSLPALAGTYVIDGKDGVVVNGKSFTNPSGDCVAIKNSKNITVRNATIKHCGRSGIVIWNSTNVLIEKNYIEDMGHGVYALGGSKGIRVLHNKFKNINGKVRYGHYVLFNGIWGGGNQINYNKALNVDGVGHVSDKINMYNSCGTSSSPIQIIGNHIVGRDVTQATDGGIVLGDSARGCYVVARGNIMINSGGVGTAGGHHMQILDNIIYSDKKHGRWAGIVVAKISKKYQDPCYGHTVRGNKVDYTNKNGKLSPRYTNGSCGTIAGWNENQWDADINRSLYQLKF